MPDNRVGKILSHRVKAPKFVRKSFAYFGESRRELKKVTWPSRRESWKLTFVVIVFAGFFGAITTLLDYVFENAVQRILL